MTKTTKKPTKKKIDENNVETQDFASKKSAGSLLDHPDYKALQKKLDAAEDKSNEYWQQVLHAKADLDNMRKRAEKDVANAHKYGQEKFILELLPVIDSLERALDTSSDNEALKNVNHGVQLTVEMFLKVLHKIGVEQVDPLGHDFDPDLHEAMTMKEDPNVKPNTVIEVMQKGYVLNSRLIRPALVIVAKKS